MIRTPKIWICLFLLYVGIVKATKDIYRVDLHTEDNGIIEEEQGPVKETPNIWAVLVAGSNEYYNYRHQADICHAYQILRRNGVPEENIITLMYDDIANNPENPTPGIIINHPNGHDVYKGVRIDYKGEDVTPTTFLNVLLGNETALQGVGTGRVLKSGPNDHVFINFADHGAPGLVAFPSDELHARDLLKTLQSLHRQRKYAKLVFYLEACESGSMFKDLLPPHWNIFATTAANDQESSYACYMDDLRHTFLGDVYSVMWMENSDQANLETETLQNQFLIVKNETNTSHVQEFGDVTLRNLPVSDFLGDENQGVKFAGNLPKAELNPVESTEVPRVILERKIALATSTEERKNLKWKLKRFHKLRALVMSEMGEIMKEVTGGDVQEMEVLKKVKLSITNWDCYEKVAKFYSKKCFSIAKNPFVTRQLHILVNMCERGHDETTIIDGMERVCQHHGMVGIY